MKLHQKLAAVCLLTICSGVVNAQIDTDSPGSHPPTRKPSESATYRSESGGEVQLACFYDYVELKLTTDDANVQVEVYDANGVCVDKQNYSTAAFSSLYLDTRSWQGVYTIVIRTEKRSTLLQVAYNSSM